MARLLVIIFLLSSCSASWHLNKAKKKGAKFQQEVVYKYITEVDTVTNEVIIVDSVPFETVKIEYIPKTRIELKFDHKKFKDSLRFERMRLNSDLKRFKDSLRFASINTKQEVKERIKTAKIENRRSLWWLWLLIGFCLNYLFKLAVKYFKP
jgi:hypothetical protein